jgi:hypothetical protein
MSALPSSLEGPARSARRSNPILLFIALNVVGGMAVLGSYVWGVTAPGVGAALWGGVPDALRPLYTTNMFLAAGGYFFFTPVVLRRLARSRGSDEGDRFARRMGIAYALILVASALWVPLTAWMLRAPGVVAWIAVRADLGLVAFGALALYELVFRSMDGPRWERVAALVGLLPFSLQTVVLDALVWPHYFGASASTGGVTS